MENTRRTLQILRVALLVSIALYAFTASRVPATARTAPTLTFLYAMTMLATLLIAAIMLIRRSIVLPAETALAERHDDAGALMRWRMGYILVYALSESLALFGFVLHFVGFAKVQVAPFFLVGLVLLLIFSPRFPTNRW